MVETLIFAIVSALVSQKESERDFEVEQAVRRAAWDDFLSKHSELSASRPSSLVARELVQFDWMQSENLMPPGYRYNPNATELLPLFIPPGHVVAQDRHGWHLDKILNPEVVVVDRGNDFSVVRRIAAKSRDRARVRDLHTGSIWPFTVIMHDEPDPDEAPPPGVAITPNVPGWVVTSLRDQLEELGVYVSLTPADEADRRMFSVVSGSYDVRPDGRLERDPYSRRTNPQAFMAMVQAAVSALRAGFILAYSSSFPWTFLVLHPWPKGQSQGRGSWHLQVADGDVRGISHHPWNRRARDAAARENIRLGYGLPIEEDIDLRGPRSN